MRIRAAFTIYLLTIAPAFAQQTTTLTGGVKSDAPLNSSVHLTPAGIKQNPYLQNGANDTTLNGGTSSMYAPLGLQQYNGNHLSGATTPTTTYTLTPKTSVMQIPGYTTSTPGSKFNGVMNFDGMGDIYEMKRKDQATTGGASTGPNGYKVTHGVTTASGYSVVRIDFGGPGTVPWGSPLFDYSFWSSSNNTTTVRGVTYAPGFEPKTVATGTEPRLSYNTPGGATSIFTSHDGVTAYVPGYEVRVSSVGVEKQTVGAIWSVPNVKTTGTLCGDVHPLLAKAQLLPSLLPKDDKATSWNLWYSKVSAAIYGKWKYADVGAGTAVARVTITADKQVEAQIVDFQPAADVDRNAATETTFRETALRAVRLLTPQEIPQFPPEANTSKVTFDVDMKRDAASGTGFDVAKADTKVTGQLLKP